MMFFTPPKCGYKLKISPFISTSIPIINDLPWPDPGFPDLLTPASPPWGVAGIIGIGRSAGNSGFRSNFSFKDGKRAGLKRGQFYQNHYPGGAKIGYGLERFEQLDNRSFFLW
jgi:hypothetical protein